jgi:DNA polymerase III delta prime subunit
MKKAEDILLSKFQEGSLAPLYILYHDSHFSELDWINNFVEQSTKLKDHPDVLILEKENSENQYKVNSSATLKLYQAINTNPIKLSKKLIFITSAQDLSDIVANKLLKIFEELDSKFCIFLICPENASMLATVLSRAVKLTIKSNDEKENTNNDKFEGINSPFDLAKLLKQSSGNSKNIEKIFMEIKLNEILAAATNNEESFEVLNSTLKHLKQLDKHSNFNNSKISTLTPFIK